MKYGFLLLKRKYIISKNTSYYDFYHYSYSSYSYGIPTLVSVHSNETDWCRNRSYNRRTVKEKHEAQGPSYDLYIKVKT